MNIPLTPIRFLRYAQQQYPEKGSRRRANRSGKWKADGRKTVRGGTGFTWESDLHLYYRRAKASETALGDAAFHRERIARLVIDTAATSARTA